MQALQTEKALRISKKNSTFAAEKHIMALIDKISNLFGKRKWKALSAAQMVAVEEEPARTQEQLQPLYTFYKIGPDYITWRYPVDTTPIKEFTSPFGAIDATPYKANAEFWKALTNYDNMALQDCDEELLNSLRSDLLFLAKNHKKYGAYTLLGSLADTCQEQYDCFFLAAQHGIRQGMVACGVLLLTNGKTEKGREWMEKGAELGDEVGMMNMAISYEHGTFTPIDYNKAAYYYRRLIKEHKNYFAYINLGGMYAMANYFHTALALFKQANHLADGNDKLQTDISNIDSKETLTNYDSCKQLLTLPLEDRIKRAVAQYHSPELTYIFCKDLKAPATAVPANTEQPLRWIPDDESEIDSKDIREHKAALTATLVPQKPEVKYPHDDFVFPIYNVQIRDERIMGSQHELIFLEKNVHAELNQFIQQHIGQLRAAFRRKDYLFVYLPTRSQSNEDIIASYSLDYDPQQQARAWMDRNHRTEQKYWSAFFSEEHLPDDCAGFLRFRPNRDNPEDNFNYEYILFPFQPGTNWEKAFSYLVQFVGTLPFVKSRRKKSLPHDTMLLVDSEYRIYLVDSTGNKLTEEIKMPILSKVLYFTLLHHNEGIAIKYLSDYKEELQAWYNALSTRKDTKHSIETLVDPTNNSANEKLSRIRKAFETALEKYEDTPDDFIPIGKKTQPYIINLSRTRIFWQPEGMSVF